MVWFNIKQIEFGRLKSPIIIEGSGELLFIKNSLHISLWVFGLQFGWR